MQQLIDENKRQFERLSALATENASLKTKAEEAAALQKKVKNMEVQYEQLVSVRTLEA